jgi:hypothetical protein
VARGDVDCGAQDLCPALRCSDFLRPVQVSASGAIPTPKQCLVASRRSSLTGEVRGYTGEAWVVFCSTSTAAEVAATIRSLASAL